MNLTPLEKQRLNYKPVLPNLLRNIQQALWIEKGAPSYASDPEKLRPLFPQTIGKSTLMMRKGSSDHFKSKLRIGVVFSGGQASGGHNVICGLFDAISHFHPKSTLVGFLDGPKGIVENKTLELTASILSTYRNMGGFDLLGSGRAKIETPEHLAGALKAATFNHLDGLVVIGGDDSNTNAGILAEYFLAHGCATKIIGVPKTIDGDLRNEEVAISFGFDTATRTYAELISNIGRDALSAKKYTHFIKLMGRSASHMALECALLTHPNITLIGEEILAKKKPLSALISDVVHVIEKRAELGKNYGLVLIPEGIIEFIPEISGLIKEINRLITEDKDPIRGLTQAAVTTYFSLPEKIRNQLLMDRDPHGNVQVSQIATEELFIELIKVQLQKESRQLKFHPVAHFLGYEGRAAFPTNFDANYCYALGFVAASLIESGHTGYMSAIGNLTAPPEEWTAAAIPLVNLFVFEERKGSLKPVIAKALVDLSGAAFKTFAKNRDAWSYEDNYCFTGPIQYYGSPDITDQVPLSLTLSSQGAAV